MNKKTMKALAVLGWLMLPMAASAAEVVPHYMNFQAVLRDDSGNLIPDGTIDLALKILDQDGKEIYSEVQPGVQVVRSSINVMVGEGVSPGSEPSVPTGGLPLTALDPASGDKKLQVQFGSNQPSDPMALGSVPYAVYAEKALGLDVSIKAADIPPIFVTQDELTAAINTETAARQTADTTLQNQITTANANITTLQSQMTTANNNITSLQSDVSGKVSKSGDTMSGPLNMGGNNITNAGNFVTSSNVNINDHEARITALEGAPPIAPQSVARAWANWCVDGSGNISLISQYNVSSVADGGNTDFAVSFSTSMPDALYMMVGSGEDPSNLSGFGAMMIGMNTSKNTASTAYIKGTDKNGNNQFNSRCYRAMFYR